MRLRIFQILSITFLISGCGTGLKVTTWISNPANGDFVGPTVNHVMSTLPYGESVGYAVYPPQSAQNLLDYCNARHEPTTQAPNYDGCVSQGGSGIFCTSYVCSLIPAGQGISCQAQKNYLLSFSDTNNFVAFSPSDNQALKDYCNAK